MPDWYRLRWYGVLVIGVGFSAAGLVLIVVSGEAMAWVAFFFFLLCAAMAVHELWPSVIEGSPRPPDAVLRRFPGPVTLHTPRRKLIFFLVGMIVFGGCLAWVALYGDLSTAGNFFLWLGAAGCAAAGPVFAMMIIRGSTLRLDTRGMQIFQGMKRSMHRWNDLSEFSVADAGVLSPAQTLMVVFDEASATDGAVADFNRSLLGRGGGLPDTYGMDAWSLAWLLNEWRARALAPAQSRSSHER